MGKPLLLIAPLMTTATVFAAISIGFFVPRSVAFSFAGESCIYNPQVLPNFTQHQGGEAFSVSQGSSLKILGYPIFASKTCVYAANAPASNQTETIKISPLGLPLLHKKMSITAPPLPEIDKNLVPNVPISATGNLSFVLDQADNTFNYSLSTNDKTNQCNVTNKNVDCPLSSHELKPGQTYAYKLFQSFDNNHSSSVLDGSVTTLDPVIIEKSSVINKQKVYTKLTSLSLTSNKTITSVSELVLVDVKTGKNIDAKYGVYDKEITIDFGELAREHEYKLSIKQLTAEDESQLEKPYQLGFVTSGGPEVSSTSSGSYKVDTYATIAISFDVGLKPGQDFSKFASVISNGSPVAASVSSEGNKIFINPHSPLPRCHDFSIRINAGLVNKYDIGGGKSWSMNSRTICQQVISIGTSVQGRGIYAYKFGTGSSEVVFVGGMHGNESSSIYTLNSWIDYLETKAHELPSNRSVIVIPLSNPDSYANGSRTNANGVDLNRNFPADDWQQEIQMPGGITAPKGGGNAPLDQPESAALASYISSINPRLVLTYHAIANIVISNDAGDSITLGKQYAAKSGLGFSTDAGSDHTFEYATTGEFEDWLADKKSIPTLLVELSSMTGNRFYKHQQAMWDISFK